MTESEWPPLPYQEWRHTRDTLHMYTQVIGKLRLALSPFEPEWANVALYVTARGLTTSPLAVGRGTFDVEFDFIDHVLVMRSSRGDIERRPLGGSVADFYGDVISALARMQVEVSISTLPSEVASPIPFPDDTTHATYNAAQAADFFHILSAVDVIFRQHRAGFRGRTPPVQFFWGSFDLALARYSGRAVTPPPGAGTIGRFGGDAEEVCAGWWPGNERAPFAAFYAYASPKPPGLEEIPVAAPGGGWNADLGEFILPYDSARAGTDPRQTVHDFLRSTYAGAATLMDWDTGLTTFAVPHPSAA